MHYFRFNKIETNLNNITIQNIPFGGGKIITTDNPSIIDENILVENQKDFRFLYEVKLSINKPFILYEYIDTQIFEKFEYITEDLHNNEKLGEQIFNEMSNMRLNEKLAKDRLISLDYDSIQYILECNETRSISHILYDTQYITLNRIYEISTAKDSNGFLVEVFKPINVTIPPHSGMNFSRFMMPQLGPIGDFLENLRRHKITYHREKIDPRKLKASQAEFNTEKILGLIHSNKREFQSGVIVSNDNYVLDGHHRWIANYNIGRKLDVIKVQLPILELMRLAKSFSNTKYSSITEQIKETIRNNT